MKQEPFFQNLKPQESADLPLRPRGFWKTAGPGAILVGLSIGAGEIIIWPRIVAEYGSSMIWAQQAGSRRDPEALGERVAEQLLEQGAGEIISRLRNY